MNGFKAIKSEVPIIKLVLDFLNNLSTTSSLESDVYKKTKTFG